MKEDEVTRIIDKTVKRLYAHHLGKADLDEFMIYKPSMDILKGAMERSVMNNRAITADQLLNYIAETQTYDQLYSFNELESVLETLKSRQKDIVPKRPEPNCTISGHKHKLKHCQSVR